MTTLKMSRMSALALLFLLVAMLASAGTASAHTASSQTTGLKPHGAMSGGGCWSYHTFSSNATFETSGQPVVYGIENTDAPELSLAFNFCSAYIQAKIYAGSGYDYYLVDWWSYGRVGWTQFATPNPLVNWSAGRYTTYEFVVDACTSHWYGDSCTHWSPYVFINTY